MLPDLSTTAPMKPATAWDAQLSTQNNLRNAILAGETLDGKWTREMILKCLLPSVVARNQDQFMAALEEFHTFPEGSGPLRFLEVGFKVPIESAITRAWETIVDALRPGMVQIRLMGVDEHGNR